MAPELVNNPDKENLDEKVDIWAAGVTAYFLLSDGQYPFSGANKQEIDDAILNEEPNMDVLACSDETKEFLMRCFKKDRAERASAEELLRADESMKVASRLSVMPSK